MTDDTIFAIASMTKPITCVAVMTLVEQGKLGLDDPVAKYLPELKDMRVLGDAKDDTEADDRHGARQAADHGPRPACLTPRASRTAGCCRATRGWSRPMRRPESTVEDPKTIAEQVERLGQVPLAHQPGEGWTYGLSHDVLGRLIEVVSGQTFDDYLQERIFNPLDMHDTFFQVPESKRDRVATIYRADDAGKLSPIPKNFGSATFFSGGGGLFSTARDYARFAQTLQNGGELEGARIIKAETIGQMTTNQIGKLSAFGVLKYGLGFGLVQTAGSGADKPVLSRYLWGGLYSTNFWIDPRNDVIAVIMTQVLPTNHGGAERVFQTVVSSAIEK